VIKSEKTKKSESDEEEEEEKKKKIKKQESPEDNLNVKYKAKELIDKEEQKIMEEKKRNCKDLFELLHKKTGKSSKEIFHALYFNSGDILNTFKCLIKSNDVSEEIIWSPKEDELLRRRRSTPNKSEEQIKLRRT